MNKKQSLALWRQGRDAWNAWATAMLDRRAEMERDGAWEASWHPPGTEMGRNLETAAWMDQASANFSSHEFANESDFSKFIFPSNALFQGAIFHDRAIFTSAVFNGFAGFHQDKFCDDVLFHNTRFMRFAGFFDTDFKKYASFQGSEFYYEAGFINAVFHEYAEFINAVFSSVQFGGATCYGDACFSCIRCNNEFNLTGVIIWRTFSLDRSKLNGITSLYGLKCGMGARFDNSQFVKSVNLGEASFAGRAKFCRTLFDDGVSFNSTHFEDIVEFDTAMFCGPADFSRAEFAKKSCFARSCFKDDVKFYNATFSGFADFSAVQGERAFTLEGARFSEVPDFIQAHFAEAPRLDNSYIRPAFIEPRRFWGRFFPRVKEDADRTARYRALKRLAIDGHDHVREQEYFAGELRSQRGCPDRLLPNPLNWFRRDDAGKRRRAWPGGARYWFGLGYQLLSDFGRSMLRPLGWWGLSVAGFAVAYLARHFARAAELGMGYGNGVGAWLRASVGDWLAGLFPSLAAGLPPLPAASATACLAGDGTPWSAALGLSIRKALPFAGIASSEKLNQIYACLYGTQADLQGKPGAAPFIPDAVDYLDMVQLVLSILLLFLFLLAVRSHFRIR